MPARSRPDAANPTVSDLLGEAAAAIGASPAIDHWQPSEVCAMNPPVNAVSRPETRIELLRTTACPHADEARSLLRSCLADYEALGAEDMTIVHRRIASH